MGSHVSRWISYLVRVTLTDFYSTFYKCLKHNGEYSLKNKEEIFKFQNFSSNYE